MTTDLRYPVGKYEPPARFTPEARRGFIEEIERAPRAFRAAVAKLNDAQLDTPYRPDGWTVRQVVHHLADSHMNAYVRFRLALTESTPTIKPYEESLWATLDDARRAPPEVSLQLLEALHDRWARLLRSMSDDDYTREFMHPEHERTISLDWTLGMYAWHCRHHAAHITRLRDRMGW
jgi:hypothetical protein